MPIQTYGDEICHEVIGLSETLAQEFIENRGYIYNVTYINGRMIPENITNQFNSKRINIRIDSKIVKNARIG